MHHVKYLWYVLVHKYWVIVFGRKMGVPMGRLLMHDASKFSRTEWGPYARWFYSLAPDGRSWYTIWKEGEGINVPYEMEPYATARVLKRDFDRAWEHHWRHNMHHWEYWGTRPVQLGGISIPMSETYVQEMIADWWAAGYAKGATDVVSWYISNVSRMNLHTDTRILTDHLIHLPNART